MPPRPSRIAPAIALLLAAGCLGPQEPGATGMIVPGPGTEGYCPPAYGGGGGLQAQSDLARLEAVAFAKTEARRLEKAVGSLDARAQYAAIRPDAPKEYSVFPIRPVDNSFGEFDGGRFAGMDGQPALPPLPGDSFLPDDNACPTPPTYLSGGGGPEGLSAMVPPSMPAPARPNVSPDIMPMPRPAPAPAANADPFAIYGSGPEVANWSVMTQMSEVAGNQAARGHDKYWQNGTDDGGYGGDPSAGWGQPQRQPAPPPAGGTRYYMVEQLVYGGDNGEMDKPDAYRLMPRDVITITVKDHREFSGQLEIQADGTVRLPNAPDLVRLRGLTCDEATARLTKVLSTYIHGETKVRVQANKARGGYYLVLGDVAQPGRFPMGMEPVRLSDAVMAANWELNPDRRELDEDLGPAFPAANPRGRFTAPPSADLAGVMLVTPHRSQPSRTTHDVRTALMGMTGDDPFVRPGQIIIVPSLDRGRNRQLGLDAILDGRSQACWAASPYVPPRPDPAFAPSAPATSSSANYGAYPLGAYPHGAYSAPANQAELVAAYQAGFASGSQAPQLGGPAAAVTPPAPPAAPAPTTVVAKKEEKCQDREANMAAAFDFSQNQAPLVMVPPADRFAQSCGTTPYPANPANMGACNDFGGSNGFDDAPSPSSSGGGGGAFSSNLELFSVDTLFMNSATASDSDRSDRKDNRKERREVNGWAMGF